MSVKDTKLDTIETARPSKRVKAKAQGARKFRDNQDTPGTRPKITVLYRPFRDGWQLCKFAIAVIKNGRVVGHIPKSVSRAVYFFLNRDGHSGFCEVTARLTNRGVDLGVEVRCVYRF